MPIPDRFKLPPVDVALFERMMELCDQIERELESGGDAVDLLNEWRATAHRKFDPFEFRDYWRSMSKEDFVTAALAPRSEFCDDVQYAEAAAILDAIMRAECSAIENNHLINWLEAQFPKSEICELIFWPDHWFGNRSLFRDDRGAFKTECELSADQIIAYAMMKSGRRLADAPTDVVLPYPLPSDA